MSTLILALALSACDLWRLDDTGGESGGACPLEQVLSDDDLPCSCGGEPVTTLYYDECKCTAGEGLTCKDGSTDTGLWPTQ